MTAALVLRPDYGSTLTRGLGRVLGTLAGVVVMGAIAVTVDLGTAILVVLAGALAAATYAVLRANYAVGAATMTALLVCLFEVSGQPIEQTVRARALDTLLGGAIALVVYVGWPTWQRRELGSLLATAVRGTRSWAEVVLGGLVDPTQYSADEARKRAGPFADCGPRPTPPCRPPGPSRVGPISTSTSSPRRCRRNDVCTVPCSPSRSSRTTRGAPVPAWRRPRSRSPSPRPGGQPPRRALPRRRGARARRAGVRPPGPVEDPVAVEVGRALDATQTLLDLTRRL